MLGLSACSSQNGQLSNNNLSAVNGKEQVDKVAGKNDVREIVWGQLSSQQKERIDGTWKDGKVSKITLNENMISQVDDKSYEGKEVY